MKQARSSPVAIAAACAVLLVVGGYVWWFEYYHPVSFVALAANRAGLIDGIESYVRVDDFLADFARRTIAYEVRRPQSTTRATHRPPFEITTVTARRFTHLGYAGVLSVTFFNDRLLGVRFSPSDMDAYLVQLLSREGIDLKSKPEARPSDYTRVYVATEHGGGRYVGWEDVRLAAEMNLWIKRYSSLQLETFQFGLYSPIPNEENC